MSRTSGTVLAKANKKLSFSESSTSTALLTSVSGSWTAEEERALVEFILMNRRGDCWPKAIKEKFGRLLLNSCH